MRPLAALAGVVLLAAGSAAPPLTYRFDAVKSKVVIAHGGVERRAAQGDAAVAGDLVRTGWFGRTTLSVAERASRFEIYPSSTVQLASEQPGVLVVLERGRLKAIFDALTGNDERLVATPGAILAVRGTRYGVEVARDGSAVLAVFEGTVEVRSLLPGVAPLAVPAGLACRFGPREQPRSAPMPRGVDENSWARQGMASGMGAGERGSGMPGAGAPGQPGSPPRQPGGMSGHGGHG